MGRATTQDAPGAPPPAGGAPDVAGSSRVVDRAIWWYALGYFAAYAPYALLTKALSGGRLPGAPSGASGLAILPISTAVSALAMMAFLGASGLWRRAPRRRLGPLSIPVPRALTLLSGACTAAIVLTTTLAYTFEGTSIVLMMLLMRGGVLAIAPIVDFATRRRVRWYSWTALALSAAALAVAIAPDEHGARIGALAALDAAVYLAAYFVRLRLMSGLAKGDRDANLRFFAEEQLVATPLALAALVLVALIDRGPLGAELARGFVELPRTPALGWVALIGAFSQGTGVFGALVLLDARENTFSVPVNRASSILAGVLATLALGWMLGGPPLEIGELAGAALVGLAIAILALGPRASARARGATEVARTG